MRKRVILNSRGHRWPDSECCRSTRGMLYTVTTQEQTRVCLLTAAFSAVRVSPEVVEVVEGFKPDMYVQLQVCEGMC
jgi:hypothetical protein